MKIIRMSNVQILPQIQQKYDDFGINPKIPGISEFLKNSAGNWDFSFWEIPNMLQANEEPLDSDAKQWEKSIYKMAYIELSTLIILIPTITIIVSTNTPKK